jgi:short-subunit dehydrogenase
MATHLVTGATSGIGALVAHTLRERGDALVLTARADDRAEQLRSDFPGAEVLVADLTDAEAIGRLAGAGLPEQLAGVVHAAGVVDVASVEDSEPTSLAETVAVNLVAPMLLTRVLLGPVRRARGTHVFVNSGSGLKANPGWASYNASKFGLRGFADALRQEEAEHDVRVSSVYPGRTATRMQERVHAQEGKDYDPGEWIRAETVAAEVVRLLDLSRDATVPDVVIRPR